MPASTMCFHLPTHSLSASTHHPSALTAHHGNANTALMAKMIGASPGKPCSAFALLTPQDLKASATMHYIALYMLLSRVQRAIFPSPYPHLSSTTAGKYIKRSAILV